VGLEVSWDLREDKNDLIEDMKDLTVMTMTI
jgi:hypothetical protein